MMELTPRQRRRQKTKQAILETARELITEKGLEGFSVREIARRIDYSPAGLYEYFDNKNEIVAAVWAEGVERLNAYLNQVPADLPPSERLLRLGLAYLDFARNNPEHFMLIFTTLPSGHESFVELTEADSPYNILLDAVQAAIEAGEFNLPAERSLNEVAYSLWAIVHGMAMLQQTIFHHSPGDFDTVHRWMLEVFARGLRGE